MDLIQEQVDAAKAGGCAFFPATEAQVARLSMQRRIFRIDGKPFMATRDGGGFLETHGTLTLLVEGRGRDGAPGKQETVQEAAAADAVSEKEIAGERRAGGAQEVRRGRAGARRASGGGPPARLSRPRPGADSTAAHVAVPGGGEQNGRGHYRMPGTHPVALTASQAASAATASMTSAAASARPSSSPSSSK